MSVLVDTSVWVDYFKSGSRSEKLDFLIDENVLVINDIILAELIPFLKIRNQPKIIDLLRNIINLDLSINWDQIIDERDLNYSSTNVNFCWVLFTLQLQR
jgi:hypothetical protein